MQTCFLCPWTSRRVGHPKRQDVPVEDGSQGGWLTPRRRWQLSGVVLSLVALVFMLARVWLPAAGFQAGAVVCYVIGMIRFTHE